MDQRRVIGLVAGAAVVVAGGTLVAVGWPGGADRSEARFEPPAVVEVAARPEPEPAAEPAPSATGKAYDGPAVKATSRTVDIVPAVRDARTAAVPKRDTERFSMVSITWTDPKDAPRGAVQVRTKAAGSGDWSGWQTLETEESNGPDRPAEARGVRGGTGAIWVGESDGVEARLADGGAALPDGLKLNLIDPGRPTGRTGKRSGGGQGGMAAAVPAYTGRAAWGADESLTSGTPDYAASVKVQFVHHTAGGNSYSCADSPAILRGILVDHTKNRGWADVGYNFLVDKCGTLFEGRRGGVDRPVIGAHTYGFNTLSSGVAVLGDYRTTAVPPAVEATLARLAAAKLGQYGLDPAGTSQLTEGVPDGKFPLGTVVTFRRISGHRDGVNTECPGDALYGRLAAIRTTAAGGNTLGLVAKAPTGGAANGAYYYVRETVTLNWSVTVASEQLTGFDVLVDGAVAGSLPGTARSAQVRIRPGIRKVQIRATHTDGTTATTGVQQVVGKNSPPTFPTAATLGVRTGGQASDTVVPVTLSWQARDNVRPPSVALTAPSAKTFGATTTSYATTAAVGAGTTWSLTATDLVGRTATSSVGRTPALASELSGTRTGKWSTWTGTRSAYVAGKAINSTAKGAKVSWTFTGRAFGLIVTKTAKSGKADVYVNGRRTATIDLRSSTTGYRQVIYARINSRSAAAHTVQVVNQATGGRPGITIDGIAYFR